MTSSLLPAAAYWSESWMEEERRLIFADRWVLAAAEDELVAAGDFVTVRAGEAELVVVRGEDGVVRAFHNFCRHRGMALVEGSGSDLGRLPCLYHGWTYGLDGTLRLVPQRRDQFADLDPAEWGLLPAAVDRWAGMVFVHPSPTAAPPLAQALGEMRDGLGSFRPHELCEVANATFDLGCNWKLFVENHVDVYHLWYLHERSLGAFDHTRFEHRQVAEHWTSWEPLRSLDAPNPIQAEGTVEIAHLNDRDRYGLGAHLVFPNLMIATAAEFFATYVAEPVTAERTRLRLRIRAESDADGKVLLAAVRSFIEEDIAACESIQRVVRSPTFEVGPLARDHEAPLVAFQREVLRRLRP